MFIARAMCGIERKSNLPCAPVAVCSSISERWPAALYEAGRSVLMLMKGSSARVAALCSSCSLQKYLKRWPAALYEAGRSVLMLMKGSQIPRIELNTVHLCQHYSLYMPNKIQYNWRGDYCECVRPAHLPVLTHCGRVTQICVFNTVKLGTSASSP